jgi:hypothetical protein
MPGCEQGERGIRVDRGERSGRRNGLFKIVDNGINNRGKVR